MFTPQRPTGRGRVPLSYDQYAQYNFDHESWAAAAGLRALGNLTADWLEGNRYYHPGYADAGPSLETHPLTDVLARANRRGLLTYTSQPGTAPEIDADGAIWAQRAFVSGFATSLAAACLAAHLAELPGLAVLIQPPAPRRAAHRARPLPPLPATSCTTERGRAMPVTAAGIHLARRHIRGAYGHAISRDTLHLLYDAHQVTIYDTEFGAHQRLWTALAAALPA